MFKVGSREEGRLRGQEPREELIGAIVRRRRVHAASASNGARRGLAIWVLPVRVAVIRRKDNVARPGLMLGGL